MTNSKPNLLQPTSVPFWNVLGAGTVLIDRVEYARAGRRKAKATRQWGGSAGNTLALLSVFGLRTALVAAIGADNNERFLRREMANFGVDDRLLVVRDWEQTPSVGIRVEIDDPNVASDRIRCGGLSHEERPARLPRKALNGDHYQAVVHSELVHFDATGPAMVALAEVARDRSIPVSLDLPRFRPNRAERARRMIGLCHLLFAGEQSAAKHLEAFGARDFFELNSDLQLVVVTRGERGAEAWTGATDGNRHVAVDAVAPRKFSDSLGAGDAFIASVLHDFVCEDLLEKLATNALDKSLHTAARFASRACEYPGAKGLAAYLKSVADD